MFRELTFIAISEVRRRGAMRHMHHRRQHGADWPEISAIAECAIKASTSVHGFTFVWRACRFLYHENDAMRYTMKLNLHYRFRMFRNAVFRLK